MTLVPSPPKTEVGLQVQHQGLNFAIQFDAILDYALLSSIKDVEAYVLQCESNTQAVKSERIGEIIRESFWTALGAFISIAYR